MSPVMYIRMSYVRTVRRSKWNYFDLINLGWPNVTQVDTKFKSNLS